MLMFWLGVYCGAIGGCLAGIALQHFHAMRIERARREAIKTHQADIRLMHYRKSLLWQNRIGRSL